MELEELKPGLFHISDLNKIVFTNEYIAIEDCSLKEIVDKLGSYAQYLSDDDRDNIYARSKGIELFDESMKELDYTLSKFVDLDLLFESLCKEYPEYCTNITDEYNYLRKNEHNITLLKIAVLLKDRLTHKSKGVWIMRGSGISSFILYLIGLNKVNPLLYGLNYMDFWKSD